MIIIKKTVEKPLKDVTTETITKNELVSFPELKFAANTFLQAINFQSSIAQHQNLVKQMEAVKDLSKALYSNMKSNSIYAQNIMLAQHAFEQVLNRFLNRQIHLTYVGADGLISVYDEVATTEIWRRATGNEGRVSVSAKNILSIDVGEQVREINEQLKASAASKQGVYLKALERWEESKESSAANEYKTFWWKPNVSAFGRTNKIDTKGVIAEGYAEAVINNRNDIINSSLENSLKNLWEKYIGKDSVPASIKGDVILEGTNVQFAIKSGDFSSAKVGQYINLAFNITQLSDAILRQDFEASLPKLINLSKISQQIIKAINLKAEEAVTESLSKAGVKIN